MGKAQVCLHHHGGILVIFRVGLKHLGFGFRVGSPGHAVGTVDHLGYLVYPLSQLHFLGIEELEVVRIFAGFLDHISQLQGAIAAISPVGGHSTACPGCLSCLSYHGYLILGISVEAVDAYHRVDTGLPDDADKVQHIGQTLFQEPQVFLGISIGKGNTGHHFGATTVHLQSTDGGGEHGYMRLKTAVAALDIPELLKADVGGKAALGNMVVKHLQADAVGNNG